MLPKNQNSLVVFNDGSYRANWFAVVKNNEAGRKWLEHLRKKNPHLHIWPRGRHSDRRLAYKNAGRDYDRSYEEHIVPLKYAERLAVYVYKKRQKYGGLQEFHKWKYNWD